MTGQRPFVDCRVDRLLRKKLEFLVILCTYHFTQGELKLSSPCVIYLGKLLLPLKNTMIHQCYRNFIYIHTFYT